MTDTAKLIQDKVAEKRHEIIQFMREIVAIPSYESKIGQVGERIQAEMKKLSYDEVRFDKMGNTVGRVSSGKRVIVFDTHVDTVGIGDPTAWKWDPFKG